MTSGIRRAAMALVLGGGLAGCGWLGEAPEPLVITLGDREFTQADFDGFVASHASFTRGRDPALLSTFLDEFVGEQLLLLAADEAGVEVPESRIVAEVSALSRAARADVLPDAAPQDPEARAPQPEARLRNAVRNRLRVEELVRTVVLAEVDVSEDAVRTEFEANRGFYARPESVHLSELGFASREEALAAAARLREDPSEAARMSERFEDIGAFRRNELPSGVNDAVFRLEAGGITEPVETAAGYRIFRVDERSEAEALPFEEVEPVVRMTVLRREADARMETLLEELRERHPVTVHTEQLPFPYLGVLSDAP